MTTKEYRLCYVDGIFAFFTTQPLDQQRGDDWNDAPYEHNAGEPYQFRKGDQGEPWDILKVRFEAELITPSTHTNNSPYSVEDLNKGIAPWLESEKWEKDPVRIFAGTTLGEFFYVLGKIGGKVYLCL